MPAMSLRVRLIASIVFVLLVSLCVGGLVAGWHAVRSVRTEMQAALAVGAQTLRNGIDDLPDATRSPETNLGGSCTCLMATATSALCCAMPGGG